MREGKEEKGGYRWRSREVVKEGQSWSVAVVVVEVGSSGVGSCGRRRSC